MRLAALALALVLGLVGPSIAPPQMCLGAMHAIVMASARQQHQEPPEDWLCSREGFIKKGQRTPDHPCACHATATTESSCEERVEDSLCETYCKSGGKHCTCPAVTCK